MSADSNERNKRRVASGFCAACGNPRVDGTFCQGHREAFRLRRKEKRALYSKDGRTCEDCAAQAEYGVYMPTPTFPPGRNWRGKVKDNAAYYCTTHALVVETRVPTGSMRKLGV